MCDRRRTFVTTDARHPAHACARAPQAAPSIGDAFDACVADGATTVVVSPYFLSPGRHWQEDLPTLAAAAASRHPGVRFLVAAPLGLHPLVSQARVLRATVHAALAPCTHADVACVLETQVLEARVAHCLAHVAGTAPRCDVCEAASTQCTLRVGAAP
jgi:sirohydrochlorin ferrochelatase